jgi:predicted unusual protein kinase regulating ubiquinone biosynthesis (AarF/ABC1/UbiB family)
VCHADPHPGNVLVGETSVTFLDFGMVRALDAGEVFAAEALISAVCSDDPAILARVLELAGVLAPGSGAGDADIVRFAEAFGVLLSTPGRRRVTVADAETLVSHAVMLHDSQLRSSVSANPALALLQRVNIGLVSMLAQLGATADWRAIALEYLPSRQAAPSTDLGRHEAAWRTRTAQAAA